MDPQEARDVERGIYTRAKIGANTGRQNQRSLGKAQAAVATTLCREKVRRHHVPWERQPSLLGSVVFMQNQDADQIHFPGDSTAQLTRSLFR